MQLHVGAVARPVAARRAGDQPAAGHGDHVVEQRHARPFDHRREPRAAREFERVAGQAETGDVGQRMHAVERRQRDAGRVELGRVLDQLAVAGLGQLLLLERRRQHAHAQRLAQHQHVARLRVGVAPHALRVHQPHRDQPVDRLDRIDGVAARNGNAGRAAHVLPAAHDLGDDFHRQLVDRHGDQRQRHDRAPAHRVDVADRVGRGDAAELVGVVHDGHEEIGGGDQRLLVVEPVDCRVVGGLDADHELGRNQPARMVLEDLRQHARRDLAAAAAPMREAGEPQRRQRIQELGRCGFDHGGRSVEWNKPRLSKPAPPSAHVPRHTLFFFH
ncbi:hypothetical protein D3C85_824660 [compost metagenome]